MNGRPRPEVSTESLAAYLEGEATLSETAKIEAALAERPETRRRLQQLREIRQGLGRPIPALEGIDLVPALRRAVAAPPASARRSRRPPLWGAILGAGALAGLGALALWPRQAEFDAKGGAASHEDTRWAGLQAYRVGRSEQPEPLVDHLASGDGLLFSYTNIGPRPFDFLMIFGVDAQGEVRWFFPSYERLGTDPTSIAIKKGEAEVALGEVIRHEVPAGPLAIHALFTRRPLHVLEVEAAVRRSARDSPLSSSFDDCADQRVVARVDP